MGCGGHSKVITSQSIRHLTPNEVTMPVQSRETNGTLPHVTQNGCPFTGSTSTAPRRAQRLTYHLKDTHLTDTLHLKATNVSPCSSGKCMGSVVRQREPFPPDYKRPKEEVLEQAKEFIDDYYASMKKENSEDHERRWRDIQTQVAETGLYDLEYDELLYGAKMAWRNAPRCIGRYQWNNLQVIDHRNVKTAKEMFDAVCDHVRYATKDGQMKTAISIFPMRTDGKHDYKFWNKYLFQYAAYQQPDGSVIGDPANLELTEVCQSLGWKGKGTPYDFLPAIVSANGEDPVIFDWPEDVPLEVELRHPKYDWFEELAIKANCIPMQGDMLFDVGGMQFPACPITGWFQSTEPVRDLLDENRYNMTEVIAKKLGYDTSRYNSLWKDAAFLECHIAVLHSFQMKGVMTQDPYTLTESFMKHMEREHRVRGGCPSDWVWIVPPSCSSLTPVFHQEMLNYHLRPALEYQDAGWKIHTWKTPPTAPVFTQYIRTKKRCSFKAAAMAVMFAAGLMRKTLNKRVKSTILFASQTGKAETFSHSLCDLYKHAFDAKVVCMDEYDVTQLGKEQLVVIVTSTFGNGDPPDNGETFARALMQMKNQNGQTGPGDSPLSAVRFAVFALGSRAYPHFCGFGHSLDTLLEHLGAQRVHPVGEGDELCGQEESFRAWAESAFKSACLSYDVGHGVDMSEATANLLGSDLSWAPDKFRLVQAKSNRDTDLLEGSCSPAAESAASPAAAVLLHQLLPTHVPGRNPRNTGCSQLPFTGAKNFHLPDDPSMPVLMVGPGTGIAPLRSFWQQRQMEIKSGRNHGDMTLVFGCRQSQIDHIYKDETAHAKSDGALTDIYTAYSREPGTPKTYVQHVLYNQLSERVKYLLENNGHIYVCGDVAMADDVCTTVQKILEEKSAMTSAESEAFIRNLKDCNRYHEDIFGVTLNTREVREAARSVETADSISNGHSIENGQ
uniref:Nitric oxide synthase 3 n=1 Tax=Branchiostoma floridae TaxID=7739 RepID=C3Y4T1_BRAFL|eukprot:XP_002608728.1 hypothetical protein BRAFLDRAFT_120590 [Branchiostoma floridae]